MQLSGNFWCHRCFQDWKLHALFMLNHICVWAKCVSPISRPFSVFLPPRTISLSAGNVILGKPDTHYLFFLLASLRVAPLRLSNLLTQADRLHIH